MNITRRSRFLISFILCMLILLVAACSSGTPSTSSLTTTNSTSTNHSTVSPSQGQTPSTAPSANGGTTPTPVTTTVPMPTTQTSCPATGTARAAVLEPLALGSHKNLVYIVNEFSGSTPTFGTLKRYDVATGNKTEIVKLPNTSIDSAQVSADGQWLLFVSNNGGQKKLQAVRMDGQGLQTLYCSSSLQPSPQWSTNQQLIAFQENISGNPIIYLLHTSDGTLEKVFSQSNPGPRAYELRTWLDNTHLYLVRTTTDAPPDVLSILDITKGDNQTPNDLKQVVPSGLGSFDSSYDGKQLFVNHNGCAYGCSGPSDITVQPALGGTQHTIFSSQQYAVTEIRAVTAKTLLLAIDNEPFANNKVDQSHNGLWTIKTDGTALTRLTAYVPNSVTQLNTSSQFPWSNVSRDGSTYAATQISNLQSRSPAYAIIIGSLSGGTLAFRTDVSTTLTVVNLLVLQGGTLTVGPATSSLRWPASVPRNSG